MGDIQCVVHVNLICEQSRRVKSVKWKCMVLALKTAALNLWCEMLIKQKKCGYVLWNYYYKHKKIKDSHFSYWDSTVRFGFCIYSSGSVEQ